MSTDFRALCAELTATLAERINDKGDAGSYYVHAAHLLIRARAALADEPAVPEVVGSEWQPCVKLPITVHVREQRPGEQHVSTREGITPVQSDDLIMLGVDGEEYPIGRELFQRTYRMGSADEPAAVTGQPRPTEDDVEDAAQCIYEAMRFERVETTPAWSELGNSLAQDTARKAARAVLARWGNPAPQPAAVTGQPSDEEWDALVERVWDKYQTVGYQGERFMYDGDFGSALDLVRKELSRRGHQPAPVPVSERLPGPEDCDAAGRCWWWYPEVPGKTYGYWAYEDDAVPERALNEQPLHWLPAHALPLPEVGE